MSAIPQPAISGYTDDKGDTGIDFNSGTAPYDGNSVEEFMGAIFNATAGAKTVTINFGSAVSAGRIQLYEVAGYVGSTCAWDKTANNIGTTGNADSGSSGTLSQANEFACGCCHNYSNDFTGVGSGWTSDSDVTSGFGGFFLSMHQIASVTTAIDAIGNLASPVGWISILGTIKGTLSGGAACPQTRALLGVGC